MLTIKVKANSITHLTDARYFAAWEVEWLGFNLKPGEENSISPAQVAAIREWVDGPRITGELGLSTAEDIRAVVSQLELDTVQIDMLMPTEVLEDIHELRPVLQEIVVEAYADPDDLEELMERHQGLVEAFILNFTKGGIRWSDLEAAGSPVDLERLNDWCDRFAVILDIPLEETAPEEVLRLLNPYGFAVSGGAEEKVGVKSFEELDGFFEALEI